MAETARVAVQAMTMARTDNNQRAQNFVGPQLGRSIMKQPTFNWSSIDICRTEELQNGGKIFLKVLIIKKNWLGRQGLQLLETLTQVEQEACNEEEVLFETLSNKFKLQCNKL